MPIEGASDHELLLLLSRDMTQLIARLEEMREQLRRGAERFASISLHEQGVDAAIQGLRTDYSRAMAVAERAVAQTQEIDRTVGATLRLANKVQQDQAALQKVVMGDPGDDDDRGVLGDIGAIRSKQVTWETRAATLAWIAGVVIGGLELARLLHLL
jgi:hypothetical protein